MSDPDRRSGALWGADFYPEWILPPCFYLRRLLLFALPFLPVGSLPYLSTSN